MEKDFFLKNLVFFGLTVKNFSSGFKKFPKNFELWQNKESPPFYFIFF